MGWYGNSEVICPKCKEKKAAEIYRNNCQEGYHLVCTNCGLHLYAMYKEWEVTSSYIDQSVIGQDQFTISPEHLIDRDRNDNIIKKGSILGDINSEKITVEISIDDAKKIIKDVDELTTHRKDPRFYEELEKLADQLTYALSL